MRRNIKILGLSFLAVFAFAAMSAASALASQPVAKTSSGGNPAGTKIEQGTPAAGGFLETKAGTLVKCTATTVSGELTSETQSKGTLTNSGCSTEVFGGFKSPCSNITSQLTGELVYTGASKNVPAIWFWSTTNGKGGVITTFKCESFGSGTTVTVKGGLVCKIGPTGTLTKELTLTCKQVKGVNEFTSYANPSGCGTVSDLLESEGKGFGIGPSWAFEQSGLEANPTSGEQKLKLSQEVKIESSSCV